jgi:hydroxypyruvate isomerase
MAPLKFCANLAFMFTENGKTLIERYSVAKNAGFKAVEGPCPAQSDAQKLIEAKNNTNLEQILINISIGDTPNGSFGCASFPDCKKEFAENLKFTIALANDLKCKK